jgi:hypothetical protein
VPADEAAAARATVHAFLETLDADTRRVSEDEWGLSLEAGGWPLHIGLAFRDGVLRVQCEVAGAGVLEPHLLLHLNRGTRFARFTETQAGVVWAEADLPPSSLDPATLDRVLGTVVELAQAARSRARSR